MSIIKGKKAEIKRIETCGNCKHFEKCYSDSSHILMVHGIVRNNDKELAKMIDACEEWEAEE